MWKRPPPRPSAAGLVARALLALALLALPACQDATGPAPPAEVVVAVAGTSFQIDAATGAAVVPFTVTNPASEPVWVNACGEEPAAWSDRWEEGRWVRHATHPCDVVPADLALGPGETVAGAHTFHAPGRYRLGLAVRAEDRGEEAWLHITPGFEVR